MHWWSMEASRWGPPIWRRCRRSCPLFRRSASIPKSWRQLSRGKRRTIECRLAVESADEIAYIRAEECCRRAHSKGAAMLKLKDETLLRRDAYVNGAFVGADAGARFAVT